MSANDLIPLIPLALEAFGVPNSRVELLDSTDHCNAKVVTERGNFFLKILSSDQSETALSSQLMFVEFLRDGGLNIPNTIPTGSGQNYVSMALGDNQRQAVMSEWIDGDSLGNQKGSQWIKASGELLARLHVRSQEFDPPEGFRLRAWDDVYLPFENGWLSSLLANSPFDEAGIEIIKNAAARTRTINEKLPRNRQNYGLIHADFHEDNLIFDGQRLWIIDLVDVGWGHFLFDLAWPAVLFAKHHPDAEDFLPPFLQGYEQIRPLSVEEKELLPEFLLAAGMGALEMVDSSPIANDSPIAQEWLTSILKWLQKHLIGD